MNSDYPFYEQCRSTGLTTLAAYVCQADHEGLDGPGMGDPDYWPEPFRNSPALCETHYALSPPKSRFAYTHLNLCEA